ncbi:MAG: hypothetical protein P8Y64_03130, partial [Gammaproteobacteria bacterium]
MASIGESVRASLTDSTTGQSAGRTRRAVEIVDAWGYKVDKAIEWLGRLSAWSTVLLVALVAFDVGAR